VKSLNVAAYPSASVKKLIGKILEVSQMVGCS
jgi:hypothetical protein